MLFYFQHIYSVNEALELDRDDKIVNMKTKSINFNFDSKYDEYIKEIQNRVKLL